LDSDAPRTTGTVVCSDRKTPSSFSTPPPAPRRPLRSVSFLPFSVIFYYLLFVRGERVAIEFGCGGETRMKSAILFVGDESTRSNRLSLPCANALDLAPDCDPTLFVSGDRWTLHK